MNSEDAVTYPLIGRGFPELGSFGLMIASRKDLQSLCRLFKIPAETYYPLYMSRLYGASGGSAGRYCMVGPLIGAPYAVMILETLIAAGLGRIVFWGWCGAVSADVKIGDIIVPDGAIIDEGTSLHYGTERGEVAQSSSDMAAMIKDALRRRRLDFHEGLIWTTDAVFRETREKIRRFQSRGALAVEMEISALFAVARFRMVKAGAILVVSDEVTAYTWKRGFKDRRFIQTCRQAGDVLGMLCRKP